VRCRENQNLSSGCNCGSKKYKEGCGGASGGVWQSLQSGCLFDVCAFGRNLASVTMKMLSCLIYFTKKFYKCFVLNMICEDNAAINCSFSSAQRRFIPINFDGSYYSSMYIKRRNRG
jgi:hypothetical protein